MTTASPTARILVGDARTALALLPSESVDCIVTSPPYWQQRDYDHPQQTGLEETFQEYVDVLVGVLQETHRLLSPRGTLWLNLGDSRIGARGGGQGGEGEIAGRSIALSRVRVRNATRKAKLPYKSLVGIPWRVALALQDAGWMLRSDIIWHKPSALPESVKDRASTSHEYVFMLSKSRFYFYDADAIAEPAVGRRPRKAGNNEKCYTALLEGDERHRSKANLQKERPASETRNARDVWTIAAQPFKGEHFAVMPRDLAERCILAGCPKGGTVLDPFAGACTTGMMALRHGRSFIGVEVNPKTAELGLQRIRGDAPLINQVALELAS